MAKFIYRNWRYAILIKQIKRYDKYKDSGIEWIGKIPQHWNVEKLKKIFTFGKGLSITKEDLIEIGIPVISYGQIHSKSNTGTQISDELIRYVPETYLEMNIQSLVNKGDFIFADTSEDIEGAGNCVFVDKQLTLFAGYHSIILKNKVHNYILGKYLSYLFQTDLWRIQVRANVNGIKVYSISQKILKNITVLVPQENEQQQIADYLDKKCGDIDRVVDVQKEVIEKLKEYKQSVITEAVTKGLDKSVPLKDSGIEWIGKIPKHWGICKIKHCVIFNPNYSEDLEKNTPVSFAPMECLTNAHLECKETTVEKVSSSYTYFAEGDVIMAKVTPCFENGNIAIAKNLLNQIGFGTSELYVFRVKSINNKFLLYFLQNRIFKDLAISTMYGTGGLKRVSADFVKNYKFALPTLVEQQQIADFLEQKCSEIDKIIEDKEKLIEKLTEYKKSLIYECVTGKRKEIC